MLTSSKDALSFSLCFNTTSLTHRDAVSGVWRPPDHLLCVTQCAGLRPQR